MLFVCQSVCAQCVPFDPVRIRVFRLLEAAIFLLFVLLQCCKVVELYSDGPEAAVCCIFVSVLCPEPQKRDSIGCCEF